MKYGEKAMFKRACGDARKARNGLVSCLKVVQEVRLKIKNFLKPKHISERYVELGYDHYVCLKLEKEIISDLHLLKKLNRMLDGHLSFHASSLDSVEQKCFIDLFDKYHIRNLSLSEYKFNNPFKDRIKEVVDDCQIFFDNKND